MEVTHNLKYRLEERRKYRLLTRSSSSKQADPHTIPSPHSSSRSFKIMKDICYYKPTVSGVDPAADKHLLDIYYPAHLHVNKQNVNTNITANEDLHGDASFGRNTSGTAKNNNIDNNGDTDGELTHDNEMNGTNSNSHVVSKRLPIIFHVHGGGWQRGHKNSDWRGAPPVGRSTAKHGMIAVCINYRLAPLSLFSMIFRSSLLASLVCATPITTLIYEYITSYYFTLLVALFTAIFYIYYHILPYASQRYVQHPEIYDDVIRALHWTIHTLPTMIPQADVHNIILSGHSAGSHIVAQLATDHRYLEQQHPYQLARQRQLQQPHLDSDTSILNEKEILPPIHIEKHIKGVFVASGIFDLWRPMHKRANNIVFRIVYTAALCGMKALWDSSVIQDASPLYHVNNNGNENMVDDNYSKHNGDTMYTTRRRTLPPFMLLSGSSDMGLERDSEMMYKSLKQLGVYCRWYTVKDTSHATIASLLDKHDAHKHLLELVQYCTMQDTMSEGYNQVSDNDYDNENVTNGNHHPDRLDAGNRDGNGKITDSGSESADVRPDGVYKLHQRNNISASEGNDGPKSGMSMNVGNGVSDNMFNKRLVPS